MNNIRIEKVVTRKDRKKFVYFPWKVYKNHPLWVPPLVMDFTEKINKKKNPFFLHAEMELFLAYRNGEITGRIAAILDRNHNNFHDEKVVFFGLYESFDDLNTAKALLSTVAEWGMERGTREDHVTAQVDQIVAKAKAEIPLTLRTLDLKNLEEEAARVRHVYNEAWEKNWGFVPWTDKEIDHLAKKLKTVADPDLVIIAEHDGKSIAFAFALPNLNEVIKRINGRLTPWGILKFLYYRKKIKGVRVLVFGILKEFRHTGVSYVLYSELEKKSIGKGYEWCETSWQLEDNEPVNRFVESLGGKVYKKYRIFEKKIFS